MLKKGRSIIVYLTFLFFQSCTDFSTAGANEIAASQKILGRPGYMKIYNEVIDSVQVWTLNQLGLNTFKKGHFEYVIDSLLCSNKEGDKIITCILMQTILSPSSSDGLIFLYGEKINQQWYFLRGASIVIPRSVDKGHDASTRLSYQQLHEIALKEVYSGYLDSFGNINEDWFKQHFENVGMCAECKTSEDFQKSFYESAMAQWANRDTTQPIKRLPLDQLP